MWARLRPERPRVQRGTQTPSRPREAQIGTDRPREGQRSPERPRKAQRGPDAPREAPRGPKRPRELSRPRSPMTFIPHTP